jgi:hypothetical protein
MARSSWIPASVLIVIGASRPAGRAAPHARPPTGVAAMACDTLAVPVSGLVALVAVNPNGEVAWTDGPRATAVHVRSPEGVADSIGRNGAGPGEFRDVSALHWRSDTLWVSDARLQRVQVFSPGGHLVRTIDVPRAGDYAERDNRSLIGSLSYPRGPGGPTSMVQGDEPRTIAIVGATGHIDTVLTAPRPQRLDGPPLLPLFNPSRAVRASGDGMFWCVVTPLTRGMTLLQCAAGAGRTVRMDTLRLTPYPVSDSLWSRSVAATAERFQVSEADVTRQFPRVTSLGDPLDMYLGGDQSIWLLRSPPADTMARWDRIGPDGRAMPGVVIPARRQLRAIAGAQLYAADTDDDGVQALVRCPVPGVTPP